ncbi:MAG: amino acid permease, partial [Lachnospiraceae bacterium]|nr:amino acid permease [Lachnospiraceae bacterium]
GWGSFVMPGTTFLPKAGPLGTALGIFAGAVVMFIIGMNYHYLMNKYPDAGGTLTYSIKTFGYDHGFLSSWFLILVYIAIIWANATALALIARNLFGNLFQFGFHYQVLGYDVYLGEILLTLTAILLFGAVCIFGKRLAVGLQVLLALLLFFGVIVCTFVVMKAHSGGFGSLAPAFTDSALKQSSGKHPVMQLFSIVALSPWAFVGFESVSNSTAGFKFSVKKSIWIMAAALGCGAVVYVLLTQMAVMILPEGYADWTEYIADLGNLSGLKGLPTFYAVHEAAGQNGSFLLGLAAMAGIITGLIGNYIAASRLLYTMAEDLILPEWFAGLNADGSPQNALLFLMVISLPIPFFGRTAIGWIIDVNTVGATVAYAYTSAAAFANAREEKNRKIQITGVIGVVMSVVFFFYFMAWSSGAMATESYLILTFWCILGFLYFRIMFGRDKDRRFGKSTAAWIGLLFMILFTSLVWVKQATDDMTEIVVHNISEYYETMNPDQDKEQILDAEKYMEEQLKEADRVQTRNSFIQMGLNVISLAIMFSIYTTMSKREKQIEVEKFQAEESSKAKGVFLANMSHDIRTPMNAIIGYINLAERDGNDFSKVREYLAKIKTSSHHLLALINDVLEMSRIESGKMDLEPIAVDLKKTLLEVEDMFSTQMAEKNIDFHVDVSHAKNSFVYCDKNRLNRVLLNLISNAYKFTPEGGTVSVALWQIDDGNAEFGRYELRVSDSGIGMTKEFAAKVFEAFERERTSTVSGIQGTGLGMAITKSIIDLMGGTIEVNTAPGSGTEFVIRVRFKLQEGKAPVSEDMLEESDEENTVLDYKSMRLLVVEDTEINWEIAKEVLEEIGFSVEIAENGKEAVEKFSSVPADYFDAILMDIQMPVMDGYEATRTIRRAEEERGGRIPIIATTANAFSEDVKKAMDAGADAHVAKPLDFDELLETMNQILSGRKAGQQGTAGKEEKDFSKELTGKRVLLAEDMFINAEVMKEILEMAGVQVETAENGKLAVELFSGHPKGYYDAVLMDMHMPVMGGEEATAAIRSLEREDAKEIPVIALTGDVFEEDKVQSMAAGLNDYLTKPVEPDELYEALVKWICS